MRAYSIFVVPESLSSADRLNRRRMLARLGLAWLIMMQVMMFAFPGYVRDDPMSDADRSFLDSAIIIMNWISLALTVPLIWYCAWPVWQGFIGQVRKLRVGMDVPVALGIVAAFVPSVWSTWTARGEVYFDSVTMFVAFLLTARYMELCARQAMGIGKTHEFIEQYRSVLSIRADRIAFWFTAIQLGLTAVVGLVWYSYAPAQAVGVMVAMLVISCPCAMAMAVPTAIAAAHASLLAQPDTDQSNLYRLVCATGQVSRQNLYGSMAWHVLMMPLAAVGWVQPWLAALTMLLSSLAVAGNSWRLFRRQAHAAQAVHSPRVVTG